MKRPITFHNAAFLVVMCLSGATLQAQAPPKPTILPPSNVTAISFQANWDNSVIALYQIQHYLLDVSTDSNFATFHPGYHDAVIGTGPEIVGNVTVSTLYYYRVRAVNGSGPSVYSDVAAAPIVLPTTALGATSITPTSFVAHWTAVNGVTQYRLDVAKLPSFGPVVHTTIWDQVVVGQGTTSYAVSGLGADTTYFFRVRTESAAGVSVNSNTVTVTRIFSGSPLAPGTINVPYSVPLQVASDAGVSGWIVSSGLLPAGLTLDANTGIVSGTPTALGTSTFTAQCNDGVVDVSKSFTLTIVNSPTIAYDASLTDAKYVWNGGDNFRSTLTWPQAVAPPPATNRMFIVQAGSSGKTSRPLSSILVSGVTYNGVAMTRAARKSSTDLSDPNTDIINIEQWYLLDADLPNDGLVHDVVVTYADSVNGIGGGAFSLKNVAQTAPEAVATDSTTSGLHLGKSITTLSNNAWLINATATLAPGGFYPVPSQELRYMLDNGAFDLMVDTKARATPGLDSMLTNHHIEYRMAQVILSLAPAGSHPNANVKAFLAGPYATPGDSMAIGLKTGGRLAGHFTGRPIPTLAVDSIAIEIRDSLTVAASLTREFAPAWLMSNGSIRDFNDTTRAYVSFGGANIGNYYVVVRHRNHLAVMTPTPVSLTAAVDPAPYDFSTGLAQAYGTNAMVLTGARYSLMSGNASNADQVINASDRVATRNNLGASTYHLADVNLDGVVNASDRVIPRNNLGQSSKVP